MKIYVTIIVYEAIQIEVIVEEIEADAVGEDRGAVISSLIYEGRGGSKINIGERIPKIYVTIFIYKANQIEIIVEEIEADAAEDAGIRSAGVAARVCRYFIERVLENTRSAIQDITRIQISEII